MAPSKLPIGNNINNIYQIIEFKLIKTIFVNKVLNKLSIKNDSNTPKSGVKDKKNVDTKSCAFAEVNNPASINNDSIDFSSGTRIEIKRADNASMIIDNLDGNAISLIMSKFMPGL